MSLDPTSRGGCLDLLKPFPAIKPLDKLPLHVKPGRDESASIPAWFIFAGACAAALVPCVLIAFAQTRENFIASEAKGDFEMLLAEDDPC